MKLNRNLEIMNSKEIKVLLKTLYDQFEYEGKPELVFLRSNKEKFYLLNRDVDQINYEKLRIDSAGLYFGKFLKDGFRFSIEGTQFFGPRCKKNIISLDIYQKHEWLKGNDLQINENDGIYLIKWENDFLGCAKIKEGVALNSVPKARRLFVVNESQ